MSKVEDRNQCIKISGERVIASFEVCKLAKERGIDVESQYYYENSLTENDHEEDGKSGPFGWEKDELNLQSGFHWNHSKHDHSNDNWYICSAYLQTVLQRILRVKYGIHVYARNGDFDGKAVYKVICFDINTDDDHVRETWEFETYEDALDYGLSYGIKLINNKKE